MVPDEAEGKQMARGQGSAPPGLGMAQERGQHQRGHLIFGILHWAEGGTAPTQGCRRTSSPYPTGDAHGI